MCAFCFYIFMSVRFYFGSWAVGTMSLDWKPIQHVQEEHSAPLPVGLKVISFFFSRCVDVWPICVLCDYLCFWLYCQLRSLMALIRACGLKEQLNHPCRSRSPLEMVTSVVFSVPEGVLSRPLEVEWLMTIWDKSSVQLGREINPPCSLISPVCEVPLMHCTLSNWGVGDALLTCNVIDTC